jgi:hypothetical protein
VSGPQIPLLSKVSMSHRRSAAALRMIAPRRGGMAYPLLKPLNETRDTPQKFAILPTITGSG